MRIWIDNREDNRFIRIGKEHYPNAMIAQLPKGDIVVENKGKWMCILWMYLMLNPFFRINYSPNLLEGVINSVCLKFYAFNVINVFKKEREK